MTAITHSAVLPPASEEMLGKIRLLEDKVLERVQTDFVTEHVFHAGMYARTVRIPAGILFTSVLIKRATLLVTHGELLVLSPEGDRWIGWYGYHVVPADAGRKQVYVAQTPVEITMIFPTASQTVAEAEAEFTDEGENLLSRTMGNDIVRTDTPCLESPQLPLS